MPAPTPVFIPKAFALSAGAPYKNTIPDTTVDTQRASWTNGFPPLTMTPKVSGGLPPYGQDVNGVLYMLSTHTFAQQAGQLPLWSASVAAAISGYAIGTMLGSTDGTTVWFNTTAANSTDPDAGGAGWVPMYAYGITYVSGLTGGSTTLTAAQARYGVVVLSGTLVANQTIVLPNSLRSWLIVNNTTGAFTTTVKTAAGTGVAVLQGGFGAPVEVYGDGTNIYPTVAPLTIPSDVAPTPDTYAVRSNLGYLYATFFAMSGALDNVTIANMPYDAGDGIIRRKTLANFLAEVFASTTYNTVRDRGLVVEAAGNISSGPAGWVGSLVGTLYTVTHNAGVVLIPSIMTEGNPSGGSVDNLFAASIFSVTANSFSWRNYVSSDSTTFQVTDRRSYVTATRVG